MVPSQCYKNKLHEYFKFQVHTFLKKCGSNTKATCNSAVAVRAGRDVFIIDHEHKLPILNQMTPGSRVGYIGCDDNTLTIKQTGRKYEVSRNK